MRTSMSNKGTKRRKATGASRWSAKRHNRLSEKGSAVCDEAMNALRRGDMGESKRLANIALKTKNDKGQPASILTAVMLMEGDQKAAQNYINMGLTRTSEESYRLYLLAAQSIVDSQWEKALEQYTEAINADMTNELAGLAIADLQVVRGRNISAFYTFWNILDHRWSNQILTNTMLGCLKNVSTKEYDERLLEGAKKYLAHPHLNPESIIALVSSLLQLKYGRLKAATQIQLHEIARDTFFIDALNKLILAGSIMVSVVNTTRRSLVSSVLETSRIPEEQVSLVCAIAQQSYQTEYLGFIEEDEQETLSSLASLLDKEILEGSGDLTELTPLFLLYAMYLPLSDLECFAELGDRPLDQWPPPVRPLIQRLVLEPLEERALAKDIYSFAPIEDEISQKVQEQYEDNPYPRWTHFTIQDKKINYRQRTATGFSQLFPPTNAAWWSNVPLDGKIKVLVAGSGTGQHPLKLAAACEDISVVALDLSRASLSYAKRMARREGIRNIEFVHGDILNIAALGKTFPAIESVGVLHHMDDPSAGLAALRDVMAPRGLLRLGLYSERARQGVVSVRNHIEGVELDPTPENIRRLRHQILGKEKFAEFPELMGWTDLYYTSGVRDLLFHVQEHRFTPLQIKALCETHDLTFLGFVYLKPGIVLAYRERFPDDADMTSLSNWDLFEQANPHTFVGMLNFICQAS